LYTLTVARRKHDQVDLSKFTNIRMIIINGTKRGITSMLSLINRVTLHPEPKYHLPE